MILRASGSVLDPVANRQPGIAIGPLRPALAHPSLPT